MIAVPVVVAAGTALFVSLAGVGAPGFTAPLREPASFPSQGTRASPPDSLAITYEVAGVKVIHRPVSATDVVAVNLYLLGGSRQLTASTAGVEEFLLSASEYGTRRYPGDATRLALAHTGSWISVASGPDYSAFAFRGIKQEFDSTWAVFADRLLHPLLDSAAMAITRGRMLMAIKANRESPETHASQIADSLAFESHAYAIPASGTEASITSLTAADLRKYADEQMMTSRMLLVVVGDIPRAKVEEVVTATLGTLPRGNYVWTPPSQWPAKAPRVVTVERKLTTNYIFGYYSGPLQSSPDYAAFEIATGFLSNVLEEVIRGQGFSYSAGAMVLPYGAAGGGIYVSTVRPDTVVKIINAAIDVIQQVGLERSGLLKSARRYLSHYYYQTESSAEQAGMLAMAQLNYGDYHAAANYGDVLRRVTGGDVKKVARQYIKNIQYGYVGDISKAPLKLMLKP
jgi:zinc protease